MLTKKNILILAALAVLGFGASMGVSLLMGPPPRPSEPPRPWKKITLTPKLWAHS